jgi:hypothetical protein
MPSLCTHASRNYGLWHGALRQSCLFTWNLVSLCHKISTTHFVGGCNPGIGKKLPVDIDLKAISIGIVRRVFQQEIADK